MIETIQARNYVWRKGTALVPAWTAFAVTNLLERHFGHLVDYSFTATMEEALDVIARGEGEAEKWLHSFYFGNGTPGLRELVSDEQLATHRSARREHDPDRRPTTPATRSSCASAATARTCSATTTRPRRCRPRSRPTSSRSPLALELIEKQAQGPKALGDRSRDASCRCTCSPAASARTCSSASRKQGTKKKPKRASLLRVADARDGHARRGAAVARAAARRRRRRRGPRDPRVARPVRSVPEARRRRHAQPRVARSSCSRSRSPEAEALYAQPKQRRGRQQKPPIAELGAHPDNGAPVRVLEGRYGPYVTDGTVNATVPRGTDPAELTLDEAVGLLRARAEAGAEQGEEGRRRRPRRRPPRRRRRRRRRRREEAGEEGREEGGRGGAGHDAERPAPSA